MKPKSWYRSYFKGVKLLTHKQYDNGFKYLEVVNESARAKIALQGAHLFHYKRVGEVPLIWLSQKSFFEHGKVIRGGIPVCWPWFGKHPNDSELPQHGFARNSLWELKETHEIDAHTTEVILQLQPSAEHFKLWPHTAELFLTITISRTLTLALRSKNCDTHTFEISSALHSYFAIDDIENVSVKGLAGRSYFDKVTGQEQTQQGSLTITKEVDRIYQNVDYPVTLHDKSRTIEVNARGSSSTVIWNPWRENSISMGDMENDSYKTMLCIEAANALGDTILLAPGEEHTLTVVISAH